MKRRGALRVGTSGYQYPHWKGPFYPAEIRRRDWFPYYAERFDTVEINNTFYNLPSEKTFDAWREEAPAGFLYALKFSRYGSHMKRLKDPKDSVGSFLERAERLGDRLGPILVQLPPRWRADPERLERFLAAAGRTHRWAVEFRDASWLCDEVYEVLRRNGAALCLHDLLPRHPQLSTVDWTYLRFHGRDYGGSYSPQLLAARAGWIDAQCRRGRDVYVYFNNDREGHAVANALDLRRYAEQRAARAE